MTRRDLTSRLPLLGLLLAAGLVDAATERDWEDRDRVTLARMPAAAA